MTIRQTSTCSAVCEEEETLQIKHETGLFATQFEIFTDTDTDTHTHTQPEREEIARTAKK